MFDKKIFNWAILFLIMYSIFIIYGSLFLVSWGHTSMIKKLVLFFTEFPFSWGDLIVEVSIVFLPLNILFWTLVFYLVVLGIHKLKSILY